MIFILLSVLLKNYRPEYVFLLRVFGITIIIYYALEYIEKFIIECNKGVLTHRIGYFVGFFAMLTVPNICAFTIALPIAIVNLFLNILPTIVLRYNTPMLISMLNRLKRKNGEEQK